MTDRRRAGLRLERRSTPSLRNWKSAEQAEAGRKLPREVVLDCGWGRLLFAHTFSDNRRLAAALREEREDKRDIAFYLRDPHVVLALAPQALFLDPSHTYRLWLHSWLPGRVRLRTIAIRKLRTRRDAEAINRIYASRHMVEVDPEFIWRRRKARELTYLVAEDVQRKEIVGTVTGVDHAEAFGDPENGSSLWCLAVDPRATQPGIGRALVAHLADHYLARGRAFVDLSVMHDNNQAIALYEKMGFQRVPVFTLKNKNPINEQLYTAPAPHEGLNPYAKIIVDQALRRGISVDVLDADQGYFTLGFGGRSIICRESLTELTSAIAMSRCDDKRVTARVLAGAGLDVPEQLLAGDEDEENDFLKRHKEVVVKPARGEQGRGITVGITRRRDLRRAIRDARAACDDVLLEPRVAGEDLRIVVIDFEVVAAAVRRVPEIVGDGQRTVRELIEKLSRRREAATQGESRIPLDAQTRRVVRAQGYGLDDVAEHGVRIAARHTANLHTGGTLHDVTDDLSPVLHDAACEAARALDIPVVGLDLMVPTVSGDDYTIIEANERVGLANHEPRPTAQRFIDLLFPQTHKKERTRGKTQD